MFIQDSNNPKLASEIRGLLRIGFQGAGSGAATGAAATGGCDRDREDAREPELPMRAGVTIGAGSGRGTREGAASKHGMQCKYTVHHSIDTKSRARAWSQRQVLRCSGVKSYDRHSKMGGAVMPMQAATITGHCNTLTARDRHTRFRPRIYHKRIPIAFHKWKHSEQGVVRHA